MVNIFVNPTTKLPTSDSQIIRVGMEEIEIGGRKSHLPAQNKSDVLPISHVGESGGSGK